MKKTKKRIRLLQTFSLLCLYGPIIGVMIYNAKDYFTMEKGFVFPQGIEVGMGLTLSAFSGALLFFGKTSAFKGSKGLIIATIIAVLIKSIINDIILILLAVTTGSLISKTLKPKINELKEIYKEERQAGIQAKALKNVFEAKTTQEINGRG